VDGLSQGEVVGLHWDDVDLAKNGVVFRRSVAAVPGGIEVKGTKTGDVRRIALGPRTVVALKAHKKRSVERARACAGRIVGTSYVFSPDPTGKRPYSP
jgi:integrase